MSERQRVLEFFENPSSNWKNEAEENIRRYRKGNCSVKVIGKDGKPVPNAKVSISQVSHDFKFGANCFLLNELETDEKNRDYEEKFAKLFNMATLPFYWADTEPQKGAVRYATGSPRIYRRPAIDLCLQFCEKYGIEPREHALAYEHKFPQWLKSLSTEEVKAEMEHHFKELAELYKDKINTIEVTNEMYWKDSVTTFYREKDYVKWCFDTASKYFTENQLVINEATDPAWETKDYYNYISENLKNGARIDAIGMQYHFFVPKDKEYEKAKTLYNPELLLKQMDIYKDLEKPLQITEITVPAYSNDEEDEQIQARLLEYFYTMWFSHPNVEQIIYWNLLDGYAYVDSTDEEVIKNSQGDMTLGENVYYGGLLRFNMSEKPAYKMLNELINNRWHTQETVTTDANGNAKFCGFFGNYKIIISVDGQNCEQDVHLSSINKNEFVLKMQ